MRADGKNAFPTCVYHAARRSFGLVFGIICLLLCVACGNGLPVATNTPDLTAPDFTLPMLDGGEVTLSNLRGQWVLLNFWATWCAPCVDEMPALQSLQDRHEGVLIVVGINQRETADQVRPFAQQHGIRFPLLLNTQDSVSADYQVIGLPQSVLINPAGEFAYRAFGVVNIGEIEAFFS